MSTGPLVGQLGALDADDGVLHDQAHALGDGFARHVEGEQRRHRCADRVAEGDQPVEAGGLGAAAGGDDDPVESLAVEVKSAAVQRLDGLDGGLHPDVDAGRAGLAEQAIDDGLGGVGDGEHAAVVFGLERDAAFGEPVDGVLGAEGAERLLQVARPPRG